MNKLMKSSNGNSVLPATSLGLVDRIFHNGLGRFFDDSTWGFNGVNYNVTVPANIRQTDTAYELELIAPGLKKENFKVSLNGKTLTVTAEEQETRENDSEDWLRNEFQLLSFTRSFQIDDSIDAAKITAEYKDGILHLGLPKKEEARNISRTIEIS